MMMREMFVLTFEGIEVCVCVWGKVVVRVRPRRERKEEEEEEENALRNKTDKIRNS